MGPTRYNSWRHAKRRSCKRCKRKAQRCHLITPSRAVTADKARRAVVCAAGAYVKKPTKRRCQTLKRACRRLGGV